jgi:hypothetical protein
MAPEAAFPTGTFSNKLDTFMAVENLFIDEGYPHIHLRII